MVYWGDTGETFGAMIHHVSQVGLLQHLVEMTGVPLEMLLLLVQQSKKENR